MSHPRKRTPNSKPGHRQQGMVLIIALVVLLVVTILGTSALTSTVVDIRVASNSSESYAAFQAAETVLEDSQEDITTFQNSITAGLGTPVSLSVATDVSDLYPNTTLTATVEYVSEGTVAYGSSIYKFKPQRFIVRGDASRDGSQAQAIHQRGIAVLSPGT